MIKRTSIKHHHAKADRDMHFTQQSRVTVHWAAAKITAFSLKWRNTLFARRLSKRTGLCHLIAFLNQLFCGFPHAEKHIHSAFFIGSFLQHALSLPASNYTNDVAKCNAMYGVWKVLTWHMLHQCKGNTTKWKLWYNLRFLIRGLISRRVYQLYGIFTWKKMCNLLIILLSINFQVSQSNCNRQWSFSSGPYRESSQSSQWYV